MRMRGGIIWELAGCLDNSRPLTKLSFGTFFLLSMATTSGVTVTVPNPPVPSLAGAGSGGGDLSSSLTALEANAKLDRTVQTVTASQASCRLNFGKNKKKQQREQLPGAPNQCTCEHSYCSSFNK